MTPITDLARLTLARAITSYLLLRLPDDYDGQAAPLNGIVVEAVAAVDRVFAKRIKTKAKRTKIAGKEGES